jgi:DNA-binding protein HU-beta
MVSRSTGITRTVTEQVVRNFEKVVVNTLERGDTVNLVGFGKFSTVDRAARKCRNPQNGDIMNVPAKKSVKFKAGKYLAETVNS